MKTLKCHTIEPNWKQLPYNTLGGCLEVYFGDKHSSRTVSRPTYQEPEQGFRTVPFQSGYPLQLDYMRRRKTSARRSHRFTQIINLFKKPSALIRVICGQKMESA